MGSFIPVKAGSLLSVDASSKSLPVEGDGEWSVAEGDGIGVSVIWFDGKEGLFLVNNRENWPVYTNSSMALRIAGSWAASDLPSTPGIKAANGISGFIVNQGVDWVTKTGIVGAITAISKPAAPAAGIIVEGCQMVGDLNELSEVAKDYLYHNARVIWLRSIVSLTCEPDGKMTLYTFEGSPGVMDSNGKEIKAQANEAIDFTLNGTVSQPAKRDPPERAVAMREAFPELLPSATSVDSPPSKIKDTFDASAELDLSGNLDQLGDTQAIELDTTPANACEIRGQVAGFFANGTSNLVDNSFTWNPQNFAGFYYDTEDDTGTETLSTTLTDKKLSGDSPYGVKYVTTAQSKEFKFEDWGAFNVMGFLADRYFAGYIENRDNADKNILFKESTDENSLSSEQLQKILIDDNTKKTVTSGTPMKLEEGYELAIKSIDIDGNKVYLELSKDGSVVDSKVVSPSKTGATMADETYYYKNPTVGEQKKLITIAVHFKNAYRGADQNEATIDGVWQISGEATEVKADTQYDKMTISSVDANTGTIIMENRDNAITLSKNMDTILMPGVNIRTVDDDTLRFYIYTEENCPATTGDSTATIVSKGMRAYQVFVDSNYIGTEGTGGDPLDGRFSFSIVGGQSHDVRVYDGQFNYPKTMFFERGGTKIINVEPGTAVYV